MIVDRMATDFRVSKTYILRVIRQSQHSYKDYSIPKRNGGRRKISQPSRQLKALQRWIVREVISHLPVHHSVMSYRIGSGIRKNADAHKGSAYLFKVDFKDFFPSISEADICALLVKNAERIIPAVSDDDIAIVSHLVTRRGRLSIGAPSSPSLSNALLYDFDSAVYNYCKSRNVVYTRYADDIVFSSYSKGALQQIEKFFRKSVASFSGTSLTINEKKTRWTSRKHRQTVTGLTLTSDGNISVGRQKKRYIRSLLHDFLLERCTPEQCAFLSGYLSYLADVEPSFLDRLRAKYGSLLVDRARMSYRAETD